MVDQKKKINWVSNSKEQIGDFPDKARQNAGHQLHRLQLGELPTDWKPMPSIGKGVREIRIHNPGEYRVIYIATFKEAIYVLHAFQKKTQKTPLRDINTAKTRLQDLVKKRTDDEKTKQK